MGQVGGKGYGEDLQVSWEADVVAAEMLGRSRPGSPYSPSTSGSLT